MLDLDGRNAQEVWKIMVEHAVNIDRAHLPYSLDIYQRLPGADLNSNSVIASVLHSVGINWAAHYPIGISPSEAPLYGQLQYMTVNDVLYGNVHRDLIFGGAGNDILYGRAQNDKLSGESGDDRLHGEIGNDYLVGGSGDDRYYGESGRDTLVGGPGKDAFVFNTRADGVTNVDSIWYFSVADDTMWLENKVFKALGPAGHLKSSMFWTGTAAHDATDRVVYDSTHGTVYYDPDGNGAAQQVAVTKITKGLKITYADFLIV